MGRGWRHDGQVRNVEHVSVQIVEVQHGAVIVRVRPTFIANFINLETLQIATVVSKGVRNN